MLLFFTKRDRSFIYSVSILLSELYRRQRVIFPFERMVVRMWIFSHKVQYHRRAKVESTYSLCVATNYAFISADLLSLLLIQDIAGNF